MIEVELQDALDFLNGKTIKPSEAGPVVVYGANGPIGFTDTARYDRGIIIGRVGAYCGAIKYSSDPFWPSDNTIVAQAKSGHHEKFWSYALHHMALNRYAGGAAQPLMTQTVLKQLKIRVPDYNSQKDISAVLSAYDDLIENNQRRIRILEDMAQSLYREWFAHFRFPGHEKIKLIDSPLGLIPQGWKVMAVDDVLHKIKRLKKIKKSDYLTKGAWPIIDQGKSFVGGRTNNNEAVYESPLPLIVFGDHTRILKFVDLPFACGADGTQLIYPKEMVSLPIHFYHVLNEIDLSSYSYARHFKFLKAQEVIIPEFELVNEFENLCKPLFEERSILTKQIANLENTRDLLLPKLISGEIDLSAVSRQLAKAA